MEVLAVQELKWEGEGRIDRDHYTLFYGGKKKQETNETVFIFRETIVEFEKINEKISYVSLKSHTGNITMLNVYVLTEVAQIEEKQEF